MSPVLVLLGAGLGALALLHGALLLHDKPRPRTPGPSPLPRQPFVSVLIPAWGEGAGVADAIRAAESLSYEPLEILVAAGGPDDTLARAKAAAGPRTRVLAQREGAGKQAALNDVLAASKGEVLFLVDGDATLTDAAFRETLRPVAAGEADAATGFMRPAGGGASRGVEAYALARGNASERFAQAGPARGLHGCNAAITRAALERVGGFDESARTGTDYNLAQHLLAKGQRLVLAPASVVPAQHPKRPAAFVRQQRRWLKNHLVQGKRFGQAQDVRHYWRTALVGLAMLALLPAALLSPWLALVAALLWTHATLTRVRWFASAAKDGLLPWHWAWVPLALAGAALDFVAWAASLLDVATPAGRARW